MPVIPFKTGRRDCKPVSEDEPYIATQQEEHPSAHFYGKELLNWFRDYFNLKGDDEYSMDHL